MSEQHGKTSRPWEPQRYRQEVHSPEAKLPEGDLVFFLLDTVAQLDLRRFYAPYETETRGAPPFDPAMMVCLLLYAYCVGVFSSRKIALACERHLAFLAIVGQERSDFRTISDFRKLHLEAFKDVFVHVVRLAGEMGLVRLGYGQANALRADEGSCSMYTIVSPLHPGHPSVGIPPVYSPRNLAAPTATSMMASLTSISSPQTGQRYRYSSGGGPKGSSRPSCGSGSWCLRRILPSPYCF